MALRHRILALSILLLVHLSPAAIYARKNVMVEHYDINALNINNSSLMDIPLNELQKKRIILYGFVRPQRRGTPTIYLDNGVNYQDKPFENCINLIMNVDKKKKIWSIKLNQRKLLGHFVLLPKIDSGTLYISYRNIEMQPECQFSNNRDNFPYFVVEKILR